jgi:hypothetical protein
MIPIGPMTSTYDGICDIYGFRASPTPTPQRAIAARVGKQRTRRPTGTSRLALGVSLADRIRHAVKPTGDQVKALDDLKFVASSISDVV